MGYLAYGAMAGVGKEYLKQSGEERLNKYQEIRDRRLAELEKGNIGYRAELSEKAAETQRGFTKGENEATRTAEAAQREADRKSREKIGLHEGQYTLGRGEERYDADGNLIASGPEYTHAPTAASLEYSKWLDQSVEIRGTDGKPIGRESRENLYKEWEGQAYLTDTDDLGNKIIVRNKKVPEWDTWYNQRVTDKYLTSPNDPLMIESNPMEMFIMFQEKPEFKEPGGREAAIESIQKRFPRWKVPENLKSVKEAGVNLDDPTVASPNPNDPNPAAAPGQRGYLETAKKAEAAAGRTEVQAADGMPSVTTQTGQLVESSRDFQARIDDLEAKLAWAKGPRGDSSQIPNLQQQIQQNKMLLRRALEQEALQPQTKAGPASAVGGRPPPSFGDFTNTKLAQR